MTITRIMILMTTQLLWMVQQPWVTEGYSLLVRDKRYRCRSPPLGLGQQFRRRSQRFYAADVAFRAATAASSQDVLVVDTSSSSVAALAEEATARPAATAAATKVKEEDDDSPPSSKTTTKTILDDKKDELLRLLLLRVHRRQRRGGPFVVHGRDRDVNEEEKPTQPQPHQQRPTMSSSALEYWESVASCINEMENLYDTPPQTVDFFNFVNSGTWTHVLCTHRRPPPQLSSTGAPRLQVKSLQQRVVDANGRNSTIHNVIGWELLHEAEEKVMVAVDEDGSCPPPPVVSTTSSPCSGTFTVMCEAHMSPTTGSSRQHWTVVDRTLELDKGSELPRNVPLVVQLLGRHVSSSTLWDPDDLASDTTYLDADLRIVRYTGVSGREGVRDVFVRPSILDQYKVLEGECDD